MNIDTETWKDIPGYEGRYQASDLGRIRSVDRVISQRNQWGKEMTRKLKGRVLRPGRYCKSGHVSVILGRGTSGLPVHQLVLLTFVGPRPEGLDSCHNDGDPTNNRLSNLRYDTRTNNILDVYRQGRAWRKITADQAQEIRKQLENGARGSDLAKQHGVSESLVSCIRTGKTFSWL